MNNLSFYDWIIFIAGIVLLVIIGYKGKAANDSSDFFLASRKSSVFVSTMSFVASEISAMTIVGVPAVSFADNWSYLQFFLGSAVSRLVIAYFFIPVFYKYNCTTIYDFVGERFSKQVQYTSSIFFFITRLFASGIRLYATALALSVIMGFSLVTTIVIFIIISLFFIAFGGIRSVLYTGVYQSISFYIMAILILSFIFTSHGCSITDLFKIAGDDSKFTILNLSLNFRDPNIFVLAILNGIIGSLASFGTDYEVMQRLLTLKTRKESQKSMIMTIFATLGLILLYLIVGTAIYVFLKVNSVSYTDNTDKIVSYFAVNFLPVGIKGFVFMTIFLASIDLPLVSLSTSFINDIYKNIVHNLDDKKAVIYSKISMIFFALFLGIIAYISRNEKGMLWFAFEINGITSGSLLGIFLLGMFTKIKGSKIIIFSMIFSSLICLSFMILNRKGITAVPWSSFVIIGTSISFLLPLVVEKLKNLSVK
ncbi:MAG: hypothetical protein KA059_08500 [Elusimicrobiales bacterium]|nr:hypothetical protein [Elusimicrobiales bacterium]